MDPICVIYHREAEGWWAESPDVKGWLAVGESYAEVLQLAEEGIPFTLEREVEMEHFLPVGEHSAA